MSTNLETLQDENNNDVHVVSFSGGVRRGRCLQLNQTHVGGVDGNSTVQLTEAQVRAAVRQMNEWLGD